jgi:hypothetical protein
MISKDVNDRPNCESILKNKNGWTLNAVEVMQGSNKLVDVFEQINKISASDEQLFTIKFMRQKFKEDFEISMYCFRIIKDFIMNSLFISK